MNSLTFNNVTLNPVNQNDGQIWITSKDLACALGYKQSRAITQIFNRNSDEFTETMTQVLKLSTNNKNNELEYTQTRIFSLRGCHLVAMFARTKIAKKFRQWVLDVLENLQQTTAKQREVFINACDKLAVGNAKRSDIYTSVANHFGYDKPVNMPIDILPQAIAYVYEELLAQEKARKADNVTINHDMIEVLKDMRKVYDVITDNAVSSVFLVDSMYTKYQLNEQ